MSLERKTVEVAHGGHRFLLRRPGRGGIARLARRLSEGVSGPFGTPSDSLMALDGAGIEMEAVLHEYLAEAPDAWRARDDGGAPRSAGGRPAWDFEEVDAEAFAAVGEEAVKFHRSFRDVDARFAARGGLDAG